ncbi:MAG: SRPBCC domain-containing protein [Cryomorphaceae bacterium]|nr:SRPBCC domain-containing protein [Cryomorphaceae bacterium]
MEKVKFQIEFPVKASPTMLFPFLSTPSGLADWFSDDVNSRGEIFTFIWGDSEESAKLLTKKKGKMIRFRWMEDEENGDEYYFEFQIVVDELTKDVSLMVIDYSEENELEENKLLWESQVNRLFHKIGS